jgi:hypothetical protein
MMIVKQTEARQQFRIRPARTHPICRVAAVPYDMLTRALSRDGQSRVVRHERRKGKIAIKVIDDVLKEYSLTYVRAPDLK